MGERVRALSGIPGREPDAGGYAYRAVLPRGAREWQRMTGILLVDDHAIVRSGIRKLLADLPDVELRKPPAAKRRWRSSRPQRSSF